MKISNLSFKNTESYMNNNLITYQDFIIDRQSLKIFLEKNSRRNIDNITPIGWDYNHRSVYAIKLFLLQEESELLSGRCPVYVCNACGDLGCGAYTMNIIKKDNLIIWKDFGYENNYEDKIFMLDDFRSIEFCFHYEEYQSSFNNLLKLYS